MINYTNYDMADIIKWNEEIRIYNQEHDNNDELIISDIFLKCTIMDASNYILTKAYNLEKQITYDLFECLDSGYFVNLDKRIKSRCRIETKIYNKFIKNTPLKQLANEEFIPFSHLVPLTNGYIGKCVWNGMEGSSPALAFYDSEYNYVHTLGNLTINCGLRLGYPLYKNGDDEVFYWNPLGTMIYGIDDKLEVCDKYHISFGNKTYPPLGNFVDDYELLNKYKNDNEWRTNHAGFIAYVWQIKNSLIFTYMYQTKN